MSELCFILIYFLCLANLCYQKHFQIACTTTNTVNKIKVACVH